MPTSHTQADIEPHIAALKSDPAVEEIRLGGNTLGVEACKALAEVLKSKKNLKVRKHVRKHVRCVDCANISHRSRSLTPPIYSLAV